MNNPIVISSNVRSEDIERQEGASTIAAGLHASAVPVSACAHWPQCTKRFMQETIYLGGGCFWCTEAVFDRVRGVEDVESGYANGHVPNPSYEQVCAGSTGHAEVLKVVFDPQVIDLTALLEIFFGTHDPTTLNRQGNDVGTQYRSAVYTTSAIQLAAVQDFVQALNQRRTFGVPVVTQVQALAQYWPAEPYHQDYFARHPEQAYCAYVVGPKVHKFLQTFAQYAKS